MTKPIRLSLVVIAAGLASGAGLVAFAMDYNPKVGPVEPALIARAPHRPDEVTIVIGGDFAPTDAAMPLIEKNGYRYPYLATAGLLEQADIAFANLESPVTRHEEPAYRFETYVYRTDPAALDAFQWLGLDVINLANNHTLDHGFAGLFDTTSALDRAGISHIGAGADEAAARRPVIVNVGGTRVGFLGYLENQLAFNLYFRAFALGEHPGCAQLNRADVAQDVARLRSLVDVIVVSVHWGENYEPITAAQEDFGRWLIDLGVDVVAGHHPHIEQAVEKRGRGFIFYSLGNYAWGAPGHTDLRLGLLGRIHIEPRHDGRAAHVRAVEVIPLLTQNRIVHFQPRPLRRDEAGLLDHWVEESARRGTTIRVTAGDDGVRAFLQ